MQGERTLDTLEGNERQDRCLMEVSEEYGLADVSQDWCRHTAI